VTAALTDAEKERCRYHLGYPETSGAATLQFGLPKPMQTAFILEQALTLLVNPDAIDRVRGILAQLDATELRMKRVGPHLAAEQVGNIKLRGAVVGQTYPDLLEREYRRWAGRLADVLGVPFYSYSGKLRRVGPGGNVPMSNG
jgi:hypothetical protein